jgi:hypothetical protein
MTDQFSPGVPSIVQTLRPKGGGWVEIKVPPSILSMGGVARGYLHKPSGIVVFSAVEVAFDAVCDGPEYHLSISRRRSNQVSRVDSNDARWVVQCFGCDGAREDNHVPFGLVRNSWRPVAGDWVGVKCRFEDEEPAVVEDKGDFVWRVAP